MSSLSSVIDGIRGAADPKYIQKQKEVHNIAHWAEKSSKFFQIATIGLIATGILCGSDYFFRAIATAYIGYNLEHMAKNLKQIGENFSSYLEGGGLAYTLEKQSVCKTLSQGTWKCELLTPYLTEILKKHLDS